MKTLSTGILTTAALSACLLVGGTVANAQSMGNMKMSKSADTKFATDAAHGGVAEVEMGKLAAEKASDPDVKAFGQQMVDDHSMANDKLMSIAKESSMALPSAPNAKQKATYAKLKAMSGSSFDKAYVNDMVMDHEEDVAAFKKESMSGTDPKLKQFATDTLPTLQGHLDKIKSIQTKMGGAKSM